MAVKKVEQTVISEGKFYTIAAANGKVIEVKDYNTDNGAKIQLWDNVNAEWQQWGFVRAGEGVYRIKNRFTGKMMDLYCSGVTDGTRVHQWEGANASSQLWVVEPVHDGRVKIKSNLAGKCLDLVNMDTENGAALFAAGLHRKFIRADRTCAGHAAEGELAGQADIAEQRNKQQVGD